MADQKRFIIEFSKTAVKELSKFDANTRKYLLSRLREMSGKSDPLKYAARIVNYKDIFRFRFGDYRVIFQLRPNGKIVIVLIIKIAHRKEIYRVV